jgi:hypothetical protein
VPIVFCVYDDMCPAGTEARHTESFLQYIQLTPETWHLKLSASLKVLNLKYTR